MTRSNTTAYDSSDDGYTHEPYVCEECRGLWDAEALADAEADRERFRIAEAWRIQQRSVAPDPTDTWNRRNAAHTHGAAQESRPPAVLPPGEVTPAPCLRRMIPAGLETEGQHSDACHQHLERCRVVVGCGAHPIAPWRRPHRLTLAGRRSPALLPQCEYTCVDLAHR